MKLFVLGKLGSVTHWTEDSVAGFRAAGHDVRLGITRNPYLNRTLDRLLLAPRAARLAHAIARFSPDLVLAVGAYLMPPAILQHLAALPHRPPLLGWVGDRFSAADRAAAQWLDAVAYTDSGLLALHAELGFSSRAVLLPHAANPRLDPAMPDRPSREPTMVFVANPTPYRREVIGQIRTPMQLYGPAWTPFPGIGHRIQPRRIGVDELGTIYRRHLAVLNIRHEHNVLAGLNQRHFDPYLAATPVVADAQPDLPHCFDVGREVLVYRDTEELNDIYARLQREPERAAAIGEAGRRRVLAEHTYGHRLSALAGLA